MHRRLNTVKAVLLAPLNKQPEAPSQLGVSSQQQSYPQRVASICGPLAERVLGLKVEVGE